MSAPICPACGYRPLDQVESAAEIRVAPPDSPLAYTVAIHRTYHCRECHIEYQGSEVLEVLRGSPWIKRKLAVDEAAELPGRGLVDVPKAIVRMLAGADRLEVGTARGGG